MLRCLSTTREINFMLEQIVYIVDDDPAVVDSVKELVESVGLRAKTFNSAGGLYIELRRLSGT